MASASLPIVYDKARAWLAVFRAPAGAIDALVPAGIVPARFIPTVVPVVVAVFDYEKTSIGPYREVGVGFPSRRAGKGSAAVAAKIPFVPLLAERWLHDMGPWVHLLPVDTEIAHAAGKHYWGFPKFVAKIDLAIENDGTRFRCDVSENGEPVLGITLERPAAPPAPMRFPMRLWSKKDDELLLTELAINAKGAIQRRGAQAELRIANHARADALRGIGLERARPIEVRWFEEWRTVLDHAKERHPAPPDPVERERHWKASGPPSVGSFDRAD
jgi:hypothetical protein